MIGFTSDGLIPCVFEWRDNAHKPCYEAASPRLKHNILITDKNIQEFHDHGYIFYRTLRNGNQVTLQDIGSLLKEAVLKDLVILLLISSGITLLGLVPSFLLAQIISTAIPNASTSLLLQYSAVLSSALITKNLLGLARSTSVLKTQSIIALKLGAALWDRLLQLPVVHLNQYTSSELIERAGAISEIQSVLSGQQLIIVVDGFLALFNLGLMIYYSGRLTILSLLVVLFLSIVTVFTIKATLQLQIQRLSFESRVTGLTQSILASIESLRTTASEVYLIREWAKLFSSEQRIDNQINSISERVSIVGEAVGQSLSLAMLLYAAYVLLPSQDSSQSLALGQLLGFNAAMGVFLAATISMISTLIVIQEQVSFIWARLKDVLDCQVEKSPESHKLDEPPKSIQIKNVYFKYPGSERSILNGASLMIMGGEHIALVGTSGSGKSTLIRLLLGFESPQAGFISYDDYDLRKLSLPDLRKHIGVVLQDIELLSGTIGDNVKAGKDLYDEDIWHALEQAALAEKVANLPLKLFTPVTSGGANLSGGERQRIMLARAFAQKPAIMIMDEATSALDNASQAIVERAIKSMRCTRITIAHRLSTIKTADRIVMMDKGVIVESGGYDELVKKKGQFWQLVRSQLDAEMSIRQTKRSNSF